MKCPMCDGRGEIMDATQDHPWLPCPNCGPDGYANNLARMSIIIYRNDETCDEAISRAKRRLDERGPTSAARKRLEKET